jgi:hypothetical protein
MKTLVINEMETTQGGISLAGFACGFGIVACVLQPELAVVWAPGVYAACASA